MRQLSFRSVFIGCLIGGVVTAMNIYIGLKVGWSFGGSLMAAILGFAFFRTFGKENSPYSMLECNITQTAGSAAGSMASAAGLLAAIPALKMLGYEMPLWVLFVWTISIAFIGVMLAVPLRKQFVEIEKLKFPTGLATANTIKALYADGQEAMAKAKTLYWFAALGFVFAILAHYFPIVEHPPIAAWLSIPLLTLLSTWGFSLLFSPMMFGAGMLIGPRIGVSLLLGSIIGWGMGYYANHIGWAPHENPMKIHDNASNIWGARGWILWPGVAIMVSEAVMSLLLSWKTFIKTFTSSKDAIANIGKNQSSEDIPSSWWLLGLLGSTLLCVFISFFVFEIPVYLTLIAIVLSIILSNVAVRSTGETDINPIGGMGKVTQGVFGLLSSSVVTNLLAAGITGAGASQAADMMQDLKTGHMLGASPRKQFIAQCYGILGGIVFAVPVYYLFDKAWVIGGDDSPLGAPAALAWKAVAEVMVKGLDSLPPFSSQAIFIGLAIGSLFSLVKFFFPKLTRYVPSGIAFGIAFIIPAFYSIAMFIGSLILIIWQKKNLSSSEKYIFPVACGLLAGEGMGGIGAALLTLLGF